MTPELNREPAMRVQPSKRRTTARVSAYELPPEPTHHAPALLLIAVALAVALTAFFAGLKEVSAASYAPRVANERPPTEEELEAAQGMEALMANMLIEQMRKAVPDSEFMPKSSGEKIFESLLDYEYAQTMSRAGTFGISELILAEMRRNR